MEENKTKKSVFEILSAINCNEHVEKKKQGNTELSYLSWAWAWHICKQNFPDAKYTIYERENGIPYWTDGKTCWVKTGVTIEGQEYIEYLPIMDFRNQSIPLDKVTSMDMNKAIQRSLTKSIGRHGLGLYLYAGEDLPDDGPKAEVIAVQATPPQPRQFNPEPMQTPALEDQNFGNLFPMEDMPANTAMDDLETKLLGCNNIDDLKLIWKDAQVLLADKPADLNSIKIKVAQLNRKLSNG